MDAGILRGGGGDKGEKTKEKETGRVKRLHNKSYITFLRKRRWSWHSAWYVPVQFKNGSTSFRNPLNPTPFPTPGGLSKKKLHLKTVPVRALKTLKQ